MNIRHYDIDYVYIVRTVDSKKYMYESKYEDLTIMYENIKNQNYISAKDYNTTETVIIDTKHIVSIERY